MAQSAHESGETRGDIEEAIYGNLFRSVGMEPDLKSWSIRRANEILNLKDKLIDKGIIFEAQDVNLIDLIWTDRPSIRQGGSIKWPNNFFGLESEKKIYSLTQKMKTKDIDAIIITQPNQLSWLLNIRGNDLAYTPLFLGFGLLTVDGKLKIFSRWPFPLSDFQKFDW